MESVSRSNGTRWLILLFVMAGVFLSTLDSGMLNVALPSIMRSFRLPLEDSELVVTVYLLTITSSLVFWGKLSDSFGRSTIYLCGLAFFSLGAFSCYLVKHFSLLLLCRFVQAIGASMMMSSGPAIIKESFPAENLGRSLGMVGIATACGLLAGPLVSGIVILYYGWNYIFLISAILSLGIFSVGFFLLRSYLPQGKEQPAQEFDWWGGLCWVILAVSVIAFLNRIEKFWTAQTFLWILFILIFLGAFIRIEQRSEQPIVPISLFRLRYFWSAVITATISFAVLFSVLVLIPFYLEYVHHATADRVGYVMMAVPATLMILSPASGYIYDQIGARFITSIGLFICFIALVGLARLTAESSLLSVAGILALLGAGQSIFLSPNSASVLSKVEDEHLGITAGILATARNFGMVAGATITASMFAILYRLYTNGGILMNHTPQQTSDFITALRTSYFILAGFALIAVAISTRRGN